MRRWPVVRRLPFPRCVVLASRGLLLAHLRHLPAVGAQHAVEAAFGEYLRKGRGRGYAGLCAAARASMPTMLVKLWWMWLCVCFHCSDGHTLSHSQLVEWISGSRIQSHWAWSTLWPISMFSRILASESSPTPASHPGGSTPAISRARAAEVEAALRADDPSDVGGVLLAERGQHLLRGSRPSRARTLDVHARRVAVWAVDLLGHRGHRERLISRHGGAPSSAMQVGCRRQGRVSSRVRRP